MSEFKGYIKDGLHNQASDESIDKHLNAMLEELLAEKEAAEKKQLDDGGGLEKANPYHDERGRFASGPGTSFVSPKC